jgi:lysozyme
MTATRIELVVARLPGEEAVRHYAYNDATGKQVTCRPTGNLSIAIGVNLENGLDSEEIAWLLTHRVTKCDASLKEYEWYIALDEPRGSVFLDLGFNLGIAGLLHFTTTLHYAQIKDWNNCGAALMNSKAAKQLPARYEALKQIILTGITT